MGFIVIMTIKKKNLQTCIHNDLQAWFPLLGERVMYPAKIELQKIEIITFKIHYKIPSRLVKQGEIHVDWPKTADCYEHFRASKGHCQFHNEQFPKTAERVTKNYMHTRRVLFKDAQKHVIVSKGATEPRRAINPRESWKFHEPQRVMTIRYTVLSAVISPRWAIILVCCRIWSGEYICRGVRRFGPPLFGPIDLRTLGHPPLRRWHEKNKKNRITFKWFTSLQHQTSKPGSWYTVHQQGLVPHGIIAPRDPALKMSYK